ncbi:MAG: bacterioferritin [Kiritimatiellae bacterium]|nr:bacterioferritin [Kiritimatiellia bacterium]
MKGNEKLVARLNERLADELAAINQYVVHSEMCANWGYKKLHDNIEKRAIEEMKHAEKLIARILFLEGRPIVTKLSKVDIGADVAAQLKKDHAAEYAAIKSYNDDIQFAGEVGDHGTRELLISILQDEEGHIDRIEEQLEQIAQLGIQNYLVEQMG